MASENQGLQIALIISVMTIVLLSVTTFMFFKSGEDAALQAQTNLDNETTAKQATKKALDELQGLKDKVGFTEQDDEAEMEAIHLADVQKYGAAANEADQTYRRMLENLHAALTSANELLNVKTAALEKQLKHNEGREVAKESQITEQKKRADEADRDKLAAQQQHTVSRGRLAEQSSGLNTDLEAVRDERDTKVAELTADVDSEKENARRIGIMLEQITKKYEGVVNESFDVADGSIRWVNQRAGTVWIDVGRADHLQRLTTFAVYPAWANDLGEAVKKADIEVTEILGDHLAEAKITSDDPSDPVVLGDLLHSPVWSPGSQEHFALATGMDIDGDGKSDVAFVRNLITMNGGVVDCWVDDTAMELKDGNITTDTRYLVLGAEVDDSGPVEIRDIHKAMTRQAENLGVQRITLAELLNRMGWKNKTPVIRYGLDANPDDFLAKPPEGVPRVSTGTVTELFKQRTPPKPPGSAY